MRVSLAVVAALSIVATGLLASCASGPKAPKEAKLKSEVIAGGDINPNRRDAPQPVKFHVFYLKQDEAFLGATFNELVDPDSPPIAEDLIRRTEGLIGPGEMTLLDSKFDKQTMFIGVVSEFTRIDQASWRGIVAVPQSGWKDMLNPFSGQKLQITIERLQVNAAIVKD